MKFFQSLFVITSLLSLSCKGQKADKEKEKSSAVDFLIPERATGWVSDFEKILTEKEVAFFDSIISLHEQQTTNQVALVTCHLDTSIIHSASDFSQFSLTLFRKWGVGTKEKNNGIGILISTNLKRIRIEVGYGLETKLTNMEAQNIIDSLILPEFKKGGYFIGISKGLEAILSEIQ